METLTPLPAKESELWKTYPLGEKPKHKKPRRAIRSLSFRFGRFQVELTIWKWRKG